MVKLFYLAKFFQPLLRAIVHKKKYLYLTLRTVMRINQLITLYSFLFFCSPTLAKAQQTDDSLDANDTLVKRDSQYFADRRNAAITAYAFEYFDESLEIIEDYLNYLPNDSIAKNLLSTIFIKKLNAQKDAKTNFTQLTARTKKYPYIANDEKLRKIKVIESLRLAMAAFDSGNYLLSEQFLATIEEEISKSKDKKPLLALSNLHTLIFNLGLKRYLENDPRAALKFFDIGKKRYPNDPEMAKMYLKANAKISN